MSSVISFVNPKKSSIVPRKPRPKPTAARQPAFKRGPSRQPYGQRLAFMAAEYLSLAAAGLIATISILGQAANWFGGSDLTMSLLPFAGTVLLLTMAGSISLWAWLYCRQILLLRGPSRAAFGAFLMLLGALVYAGRPSYQQDLQHLRTLVGGVEQAGRDHIGHQVYAAYRRTDLLQMKKILERSTPVLQVIATAARQNGINAEILVGIGATESSFVARDSADGGRGLFQITATPKAAIAEVARQLKVKVPDPMETTQNIYLAAATFRQYLDQMKGDLFLGLLAYNIGPKNGGLQSIMAQYGARDFYTIQPYLQHLPRDYPIRVLSAALAFRLWQREGALPRYEEGENAKMIQALGIPGLDLESSLAP